MRTLQPRPGFDWGRVYWSRRVRPTCSYCRRAFNVNEFPLRLFRNNGETGAAFCQECQKTWWGIEGFDDLDDDA